MRPRNRGTIVQAGSALSYRAIPLQAAYSGAKFAIRGFTDSLRVELLHDRSGVHVTMVHLPSVHTAQFDWGRTKLPWLPRPLTPVVKPENRRGGDRRRDKVAKARGLRRDRDPVRGVECPSSARLA